MKRIVQVIALSATLGATPAIAVETDPIAGSSRDPFSQTYTGRDPEVVRAAQDQELRAEVERAIREQRAQQAGSSTASCACGATQAPRS